MFLHDLHVRILLGRLIFGAAISAANSRPLPSFVFLDHLEIFYTIALEKTDDVYVDPDSVQFIAADRPGAWASLSIISTDVGETGSSYDVDTSTNSYAGFG